MPFEDVMGALQRWGTATDALAALGAELALLQPGADAPPEIVGAVRAVSTAAGLTDLDTLAPPQQAMVLSLIRSVLHQAVDLVDDPGRAPGWTFTDPAILDGWGRGSAMVPPMIAGAHPDLASLGSFLDVGTGVGLLAIAATTVWPEASVVGIDPWEPSLDRARANVARAGLDDRITLRQERLAETTDVDAYDCVWIPTFFMPETDLVAGAGAAVRAVRPGGWLVLGRMRTPPDPLAEATKSLTTIRSGGCDLDPKRAVAILEETGCTEVHEVEPAAPGPLAFVLGRRPG